MYFLVSSVPKSYLPRVDFSRPELDTCLARLRSSRPRLGCVIQYPPHLCPPCPQVITSDSDPAKGAPLFALIRLGTTPGAPLLACFRNFRRSPKIPPLPTVLHNPSQKLRDLDNISPSSTSNSATISTGMSAGRSAGLRTRV